MIETIKAWYRRWKWTRTLRRCQRARHAMTAMSAHGRPAKACKQCGYYVQITAFEFKGLFGRSFNQVVRAHHGRKGGLVKAS